MRSVIFVIFLSITKKHSILHAVKWLKNPCLKILEDVMESSHSKF